MKAIAKNKKFTLEKFEVAKLKNMKVIMGGSATIGGNDDTITINQQGNSSKNCQSTVGTIVRV